MCSRCILHCRGEGRCGVVAPGRGDLRPWRALWLSVLRVEDVPLAHTCPGGVAARLMLPGSPVRCSRCSWRDYADPRGLELRRLEPGELRRLRMLSPSVFLLDGGEPLVADWVMQLPGLVREAAPGVRYVLARTAGLVALERLREAREAGYNGVVFEYLLAVEKLPRPDHAAAALREAHRLFEAVEIHVPYDGSPGAAAAVADLAARYPGTPVHVLPLGEELGDKAYSLVEKLRDRGRWNVYLYPEESYTLTDTACPRCGAPVVSRKPWGVRVYADAGGGTAPRCPRCGEPLPWLRLCGPPRRAAIHRETVVW